MSSYAKRSFGNLISICFWHTVNSALTQNRVAGRVLPEATRLCVKAGVRGCVGVLLHATPQLSSAGYFI